METIARTHLVVLALTALTVVRAQDSATQPIDGADEICRDSPEPIWIADKENNCWYWRCNKVRGQSYIIPTARRCAVGTKVSDYFDYGPHDPCEILFLETERFNCTRKTIITRPPVTTLDPIFLPCNSPHDYCLIEARRLNLTETNNPCGNNAKCINMCDTFKCTSGQVSCPDYVECLNGGTCIWGPEGTNSTFTCICGSEFTGRMCEDVIDSQVWGESHEKTNGDTVTIKSASAFVGLVLVTSTTGMGIFIWRRKRTYTKTSLRKAPEPNDNKARVFDMVNRSLPSISAAVEAEQNKYREGYGTPEIEQEELYDMIGDQYYHTIVLATEASISSVCDVSEGDNPHSSPNSRQYADSGPIAYYITKDSDLDSFGYIKPTCSNP